jgi:plastocyanin
MRIKHAVVGCVCLLLLGTAAAGCGGGSNTGGGKEEQDEEASPSVASGEQTGTETPLQIIQVNETEMSLDPSEITLQQPGAYVFRAVNVGDVVHSLRIEGNGIEEQQTRDIEPGESADLTVTLGPGTYELDCPVDNHEELGMRGSVTVAGD